MTVSPVPSPEEVSTALRQRLAGKFSGEVADVEVPVRVTGGFDFWIYGLHFGGAGLPAAWKAPVIARIPAAAERFTPLERECRLQAWIAARGYPVPPLLELIGPGELFASPVQVMQRVAGTRMDQLIAATPPRIPTLVGKLAAAQAALHRLPVPEPAQAGPDWALADTRLALTRHVVAQGWGGGPLAEALERTERIVPLLEVPDPAICHGDFHPRNLLLDAGTVWVIDWTDAGVGDRHGDIARTEWTFRFAAVAINGTAGRAVNQALAALSRDYVPSYRRYLPVDEARLRLWMPLQHLNAWAMAVAGEQGFFGPSPPGSDSRIATWAKRQFLLSIEQLP